MSALSSARKLAVVCAIALVCSACFESKSSITSPDDSSGGASPPPSGSANRAPTITGTPPTALRAGEAYSFQPNAADADGDALTFSIQNRPAWATFSSATGRLTGTPGAGDVGQFSNVRISVSDGAAQASLGAFTIAVNQIAMGSVTLSWVPPTTNVDGSPATDLAGYRIYFGRSAGALDQTVVISNAGTTRYVLDNLSPATWYFSMTSYNTTGIESPRSTTVSRTLT